jgi:hypothetical protein
MEIDRLKHVWQQSGPPAKPDTGEEMRRIAARFTTWRRQVRWRDYRECAAAVVCMLLFGRLVFVLASTVARAAAVFLVGSSALTVVMLIRARPGRQLTDPAVAVREFCENELRRIDAQIGLLRSVAYWGVAPVLVGTNVLFAALSPRLAWTIAYVVVTLVFGWWIVHLNQRAAREYLVPLRDELVRILGEES